MANGGIDSVEFFSSLDLVSKELYESWFAELPEDLRSSIIENWGEPVGEGMVHNGKLLVTGVQFGNTIVCAESGTSRLNEISVNVSLYTALDEVDVVAVCLLTNHIGVSLKNNRLRILVPCCTRLIYYNVI